MNTIYKGIKHLSKSDKVISRLIKKFGNCNLQPRNDYFNFLIKSIIGQQLSLSAAASICKRFEKYFGSNPEPIKIIRARETTLRKLGLSKAKSVYVKELASAVYNKNLILDNIDKLTDEEIIEELIKVKGIGTWTAHMFLIFALARLNILPSGDLGFRKAIMLNYGLKNLPTEKEVVEISGRNGWSPYNSLAALYLWKSLEE